MHLNPFAFAILGQSYILNNGMCCWDGELTLTYLACCGSDRWAAVPGVWNPGRGISSPREAITG